MRILHPRKQSNPTRRWPYFFDEADYRAMQTDSPAPVFSCWNGIVVFNADPLIPIHLRSNRTLSIDPLPYDLPATHPAAQDPAMRGPSPALTPPIQFRASAPGECFSSESFLLPYDLRRQFNLQRIFVNPRVITAYKWRYVSAGIVGVWLMDLPCVDITRTLNGSCAILSFGGGSKRCMMGRGWRGLCLLWAMKRRCIDGMEGIVIRGFELVADETTDLDIPVIDCVQYHLAAQCHCLRRAAGHLIPINTLVYGSTRAGLDIRYSSPSS